MRKGYKLIIAGALVAGAFVGGAQINHAVQVRAQDHTTTPWGTSVPDWVPVAGNGGHIVGYASSKDLFHSGPVTRVAVRQSPIGSSPIVGYVVAGHGFVANP